MLELESEKIVKQGRLEGENYFGKLILEALKDGDREKIIQAAQQKNQREILYQEYGMNDYVKEEPKTEREICKNNDTITMMNIMGIIFASDDEMKNEEEIQEELKRIVGEKNYLQETEKLRDCGKEKGEKKLCQLVLRLFAQNRISDVKLAAANLEARKKLYQEFLIY